MAVPVVVAALSVACFICLTGAYDLVPSGSTVVASGGGLYLRYVDVFPNLTECAVEAPGIGKAVLTGNRTTWPLYFGTGYEKGSCAAIMLNMTANNAGLWKLQATFQENDTKKVEIQGVNVTVSDAPSKPSPVTMQLPFGDVSAIQVGSEDSVYCMLRDPLGHTVSVGSGFCQHTVTTLDQGVWTATYALPGSLQEIEVNYTVEAVKVELFTSVQPSSSVPGGLDLLCRLPALYRSGLLFCRMVHPNGTGIHLQEGLSDGIYSYYGGGLTRAMTHDCGVTIHRPTKSDLGPWKCIFAFATGLEGGYIYVTNNTLPEPVTQGEPLTESVVALSGVNVTVGCRAPVSLGSCWFRHPDGSLVTPEMFGLGRYGYFGDGLSLGSCSVRFTAQPRDSGRWTCYMGVPDHIDGDLYATVDVQIIEEPLEAIQKEVVATERGHTTIGCRSVTGDGLNNCRFVHPKGWGMTFSGQQDASAVKGRYRYAGNGLSHGECFLRITDVREEDFGEWVCAAALEGQEVGETLTIINIIEEGGLSTGAIAAIVSICLVASAVGVAMILGYRKRRKSSHV
ncbi:uncharacterized protein LOC126253187 [Schistocerca nitens]|uniref:uncharacterized protein LOC126253187 n=1 Tax=Schistocerca nitens TaxID=7011 RepID=UPI002117AA00|nr:uncharacterized protein LOC126253187 [Schistocerca nitens]